VAVGIDMAPAVEPLLAADADGGSGVDVDEHCRAALPSIYAISDCAAHENRFAGGARIRVESNDRATTAKAIIGARTPMSRFHGSSRTRMT
jgi:3-phenylpropionate/trans-cinnamate dioxygenase ferredoxin reductase subunit